MNDTVEVREVTIPACDEHGGWASTRVSLLWECPQCGGPRGDVRKGISYDGSRRLTVDQWDNPCGHVDLYRAIRKEAGQ
jgi:hypothetical protein